jgi:hypothetical protein
MSTTPHPVTPEEIMAHLDGELSAVRAQSVSAHVESCAACQETITSLQNVSQQLGNWQVEPLPARLSKQAAAADLEKSAKRGGSPLSGLTRQPRIRVIGWTAGLAVSFVLILAISIPNLLRSRMAANESSSVGSLRTINTAAATYAQTYGHYPPSLKSLGPSTNGQPSENGAGLIDSTLANGERSGYRFSYQAAPGAGENTLRSYKINAEPLSAGSSGQRRFSTDQTGVLSADDVPFESGRASSSVSLRLVGPSASPVASPRVAADSNGLMHGLGDHAENSFSVDGKLVSEQESHVLTGPMIARTVSLSLFTKEFESSRASLDAILVRHNGYAAELNVATPLNAARSFQASLRIPATQLPAALAELRSLGRVEGETQSGEEVTQQHADLVARLKNSRETEQRLQGILTERTGKISDVLAVEQEIARVRGEIEQMEAEQKNLEHRVDFATIELKLSEEYKAKLDSPAPAIATLIHNAAVNGYRNVADTLLSIVLFFAEYGPVLIFWLLLFFIPAWLVWRRWRHATAAI